MYIYLAIVICMFSVMKIKKKKRRSLTLWQKGDFQKKRTWYRSMHLEKPKLTPPHLSDAFETVPMFFLTDNGPLSSFQCNLSSASSFRASLPQMVDGWRYFAKTSHNKICDVTLMKKGLGEGLTKGLKAFCQVALCLFKYALYVFHTKRLCAILSMFITYYVLWP